MPAERWLRLLSQEPHPTRPPTKPEKAKYTGLHCLRHFYASWCINRRADGGLELPLKLVQARLGHASIQMTADRYGHLFPELDEAIATAFDARFRSMGSGSPEAAA